MTLLYPTFLDGEFLKLNRRDEGHDKEAQALRLSGDLKVAILLGFRFSLIDMHVLDGSAAQIYFADPQFREFVREFPDLFELRARPRLGTDTALPERLRMARSGLHRTKDDTWTSSAFNTADAKLFAAWLLDQTSSSRSSSELLDLAGRSGFLEDQYPYLRRQRIGIIYALDHFALGSGRCLAPPPDATYVSYHEVLAQAYKSKGILDDHARILGPLLSDIDNIIPRDDRTKRSALRALLDERARSESGTSDGVNDSPEWRTAVLAWNCATAESNGIAESSHAFLPSSVPVPMYCQYPTAMMLDNYVSTAGGPLASLLGLPFEFSALDWSAIRRLYAATHKDREDFVDARLHQDAASVDEAFDLLKKQIAAHIAKYDDRVPSIGDARYLWLFLAGILGPEFLPPSYAQLLAQSAGAFFGAAVVGRLALQWSSRLRVLHTLRMPR